MIQSRYNFYEIGYNLGVFTAIHYTTILNDGKNIEYTSTLKPWWNLKHTLMYSNNLIDYSNGYCIFSEYKNDIEKVITRLKNDENLDIYFIFSSNVLFVKSSQFKFSSLEIIDNDNTITIGGMDRIIKVLKLFLNITGIVNNNKALVLDSDNLTTIDLNSLTINHNTVSNPVTISIKLPEIVSTIKNPLFWLSGDDTIYDNELAECRFRYDAITNQLISEVEFINPNSQVIESPDLPFKSDDIKLDTDLSISPLTNDLFKNLQLNIISESSLKEQMQVIIGNKLNEIIESFDKVVN